jgi:hypothetical protein
MTITDCRLWRPAIVFVGACERPVAPGKGASGGRRTRASRGAFASQPAVHAAGKCARAACSRVMAQADSHGPCRGNLRAASALGVRCGGDQKSPCTSQGRPGQTRGVRARVGAGRLVVQYSVRSVQVRRLYEPSMLPHTSPPGAVMSCPAGRHGRRDDVFRFVFGVACCAVPGAFPGRETRHQNVTGGSITVADWLDRGGIIHPHHYQVNTRFLASRSGNSRLCAG